MTAKELKALRVQTGLSQESFGVQVLHVSGRTIARWESSEAQVSGIKEDGIYARVADWLERRTGNGP